MMRTILHRRRLRDQSRAAMVGAIMATLAGLAAPGTPAATARPVISASSSTAPVVTPAGSAGAIRAAHEVPASVQVRAIVRPEGRTLRLLVRVPLEAMRDYAFPTRGAGYLVMDGLEPMLMESAGVWVADYVTFYENGVPLPRARVVAARVSIPTDPSFESYERALAHIRGPPLPDDVDLVWQHALLDAEIVVPITSDSSEFAVRPEFAHLGVSTRTSLQFVLPDGRVRAYQFDGNPGLIRLDPRWHHAALQFVGLGFRHILEGMDHLLFVLLLVVPYRRIAPLFATVTAFTVAHSVTLIASALGFGPGALWFPTLIEVLIAVSILFMAIENIIGIGIRRRWVITFAFGLVHGFGFSWHLRESLQFAGSHLLTSLVAFNIGVELGQLAAVLVMAPALALLFRFVVAERIGVVIVSVLVGHVAWHWTAERGSELIAYDFQWPALDLFFLAAVLRWLMLLLLAGTAAWVLYGLLGKLLSGTPRGAVSRAAAPAGQPEAPGPPQ